MELKFEEIYEEQPQEIEGNNYVNYWSNANTDTDTNNNKKTKISYDNILSSLNMVVNNGVLQFAKPINNQHQINQPQIKQSQQQKQKTTVPVIPRQHQSLPQNDYITNKYFKNYQQHQEQNIEEHRIPKTKEEYRQMLIENYIKRQEAQRRLSQIKSKKLLFDTRNINIAPNQMPRDMNKLFSTFKRNNF